MTNAIFNKLAVAILFLLVVVTIPFDIAAVKKWAEEYGNLKLLLSILRPLIGFTCLYFGIFYYVSGKRFKKTFKGAGSLIILGAVYSLSYISEVLITAYFLHNSRTTLLQTTELIKSDNMSTALIKTNNMITAANVYLMAVAIIFLAVTICFVVMLKKVNAKNDTEQNAKPDSQ